VQERWREEIKENFQKMKAEGSHLPQLEEELIRRRKEELRYLTLKSALFIKALICLVY
jgi:hypothetical protein